MFAFIVVLSLLVTSYGSAAHAFGLVPACDPAKMAAQHMADCCKHDRGAPNCLKCDCCMAVVQVPALPAFFAVGIDMQNRHVNERGFSFTMRAFVYPQFRPPNSIA